MTAQPQTADNNAAFPERLGRYRLLRCVSTGGMARVYEGRRESLAGVAPKVAIKVILPEHANDTKFQQLFVNEARIGSQLQHQNVVQIQDFDREGDCYYLVMEYVEGLTFRRAISHCKRNGLHIPLSVIAELGRQMSEGLHYAHTARSEDGNALHLVHRDIKPSNLILNPQGVVKILDFGISKALIASESRGTVKGTWGYMSPEQADGGEVTARADQYGVAAVLYELAMLQPLFPEKEPRILRALMGQDEGARRANRLMGMHGPLAPVLVRALQRDAYGRYPTCMAMAQDLARLVPDQVLAREQVLQFQSSILALDRLRKDRRGRTVAAVVMPGPSGGQHGAGAQAISLQSDRNSEVSGVEEVSDVADSGASSPNQPSFANQGIHPNPGPLPVLRPVILPPLAVQIGSDPRQAGLSVAVGNAYRPYGAEELVYPPVEEQESDTLSTWVLAGVMMAISAAVLLFVVHLKYQERQQAILDAQNPVETPAQVEGPGPEAGTTGAQTGMQSGTQNGAQSGTQATPKDGSQAGSQTGSNSGSQTGSNSGSQTGSNSGSQTGRESGSSSGRDGQGSNGRTGNDGPDEINPRLGQTGQVTETPPNNTIDAPPPAITGQVTVTSSKASVILVDGQVYGKSISKTITLPAGPHSVAVRDDATGSVSAGQRVDVMQGANLAFYWDWETEEWTRD